MFIQYNDLKDDNRLPAGACYIEPRDSEAIYVAKGETLAKFIERVSESRAKKGYPELPPAELRALVVSSIERNVSREVLREYFEPHAARPNMSQVVQLARTLARQVGQREADYNTRQSRTAHCLGCAKHKAHNNIGRFSNAVIGGVIKAVSTTESLANLHMSQEEQKLGVCGMCGCNLANKIRLNLSSVIASIGPHQIDSLLGVYGDKAFDACWILHESLDSKSARTTLEMKLGLTRQQYGRALLTEYIKNKALEAAKNKG